MLDVVRKPPRWLRIVLAALLLAFALNSIAHVAHHHDATTPAVHSLACGYCASFGAMADGPRHAGVAPIALLVTSAPDAHPIVDPALSPRISAQPRGPPVS